MQKRRGGTDSVLSAPSGVTAPKISLQPHLVALWAQAQKFVWLWQKCMGYPKSDTVAVQFPFVSLLHNFYHLLGGTTLAAFFAGNLEAPIVRFCNQSKTE